MQEQFHLLTKLLIIYGCRTWEICGALKEEFDFKAMVWSAPPERVKNKRWLVLPITPLAKELIDRLWLYSRDSKYIFPGRYSEEKPIHKTSLAHAIARIDSVQGFSPRDLRRTVKTRMGEIGIEKSIRDRIQNHALNDVSSKHYDRYDYLQEKKTALLAWEKYLLELTEKD
jgi:integrase